MAKVLQGQSLELFNEGIGLTFSRWQELRDAVEGEWGGRNSHLKAQQLAVDVLHWFTQSKETLYIDDLENLLEEGMDSLNLMFEDGSIIDEVAHKLMVMHEECLDGNFSEVERLREESRNPASYRRVQPQIVNGDEDEDSDEDIIEDENSANMDVDIQKSESNLNSMNKAVNGSQPKVAGEATDDGWTVVSNKKNKGRKN